MSAAHAHSHAPANFNKAFAIGIGLNMAFVAIEAFYGWQINSLALLADAGHNLSDVAGLVLAWGGALAGRLLPNPRHTYGWKRGSILAAFANALLLLVAMGALVWEAVGRLMSPQPLVSNEVMTIIVVAGALTLWMGWNWLDPVVSLLIAAVILWGTWSLFRQSLHLLFDGVPDSVDPQAVRDYLAALPGISRVHDLHIWGMDTSQVAITAQLVMPSGHANDAFLREVTAQLHDRFEITHATLQVVNVPFTEPCGAWSTAPGVRSDGHQVVVSENGK